MAALLDESLDDRPSRFAGEVAARIERLPLSSWQVRTRIIIGTATFFDAFDALSIAYILPVIVPLWKLTPQETGFLISAGFFGQLFGALFFGWYAERYGRMKALVASIATFAILSFACAFSWDYASLLILRTLQGFGLGGEVPVAATYIGELAKAKGRGRFVLLFELVFPCGILAASLLGLWMVPTLGWQSMFFVGAIPAVLVLFLQRLLPESPRWLAAHGRYAEAEAALRVVEIGTEKALGRKLPTPDRAVITPLKRSSLADLFRPLYLRRTLVAWVMRFATYFVNYRIANWMPTLYRTIFHLPLDVALRYQLVTNVVTLFSSFACAMLIDLTGRRAWFVGAFACSAVALLVLWYIGPSTPGRVLFLGTLSNMCTGPMALAGSLYPPELYPTLAGALGFGLATAWLGLAR